MSGPIERMVEIWAKDVVRAVIFFTLGGLLGVALTLAVYAWPWQ